MQVVFTEWSKLYDKHYCKFKEILVNIGQELFVQCFDNNINIKNSSIEKENRFKQWKKILNWFVFTYVYIKKCSITYFCLFCLIRLSFVLCDNECRIESRIKMFSMFDFVFEYVAQNAFTIQMSLIFNLPWPVYAEEFRAFEEWCIFLCSK